jgi:hypothetical protein
MGLSEEWNLLAAPVLLTGNSASDASGSVSNSFSKLPKVLLSRVPERGLARSLLQVVADLLTWIHICCFIQSRCILLVLAKVLLGTVHRRQCNSLFSRFMAGPHTEVTSGHGLVVMTKQACPYHGPILLVRILTVCGVVLMRDGLQHLSPQLHHKPTRCHGSELLVLGIAGHCFGVSNAVVIGERLLKSVRLFQDQGSYACPMESSASSRACSCPP